MHPKDSGSAEQEYPLSQKEQEPNILEVEMELPDDEFIVSRTNTEGIITYVSDSFCRISEYEREELMGRPHNIIRHPDMPRSAFKDMWETIKKMAGVCQKPDQDGQILLGRCHGFALCQRREDDGVQVRTAETGP